MCERVLLVKPVYYGSYYQDIAVVSGLGYISEALNQAGITNTVGGYEVRLQYQ